MKTALSYIFRSPTPHRRIHRRMGAVVFAIGLKLLVPTPGKHGFYGRKGLYRMTFSFTGRKRLRKNFGKISGNRADAEPHRGSAHLL